jgi:hypothetical protein
MAWCSGSSPSSTLFDVVAAMMKNEFRAHRMTERKHISSFFIRREINREQDKEKQEEERA